MHIFFSLFLFCILINPEEVNRKSSETVFGHSPVKRIEVGRIYFVGDFVLRAPFKDLYFYTVAEGILCLFGGGEVYNVE
jgi:hypothetical protein